MTPLEVLESARLAQLRQDQAEAQHPPETPPAARDPLFRLAAWVLRGCIKLVLRVIARALPRLDEHPNERDGQHPTP